MMNVKYLLCLLILKMFSYINVKIIFFTLFWLRSRKKQGAKIKRNFIRKTKCECEKRNFKNCGYQEKGTKEVGM